MLFLAGVSDAGTHTYTHTYSSSREVQLFLIQEQHSYCVKQWTMFWILLHGKFSLTFTRPLFIHSTHIYQVRTTCVLFAIHQRWIIHASWPGEDHRPQRGWGSCQILVQCVKCDSTATWSVGRAQRKPWVTVCRGAGGWNQICQERDEVRLEKDLCYLSDPIGKWFRQSWVGHTPFPGKRQRKGNAQKISQLCFLLLQESSVLLKRKYGLRFSGR